MSDIRLATAASLLGVRMDWLIKTTVEQASQFRSVESVWHYFGKKYYGNRYFGSKYFAPPGIVPFWFSNIRSTGMIDDTHELETAALVALGTDSLADVDDILPDPDSTDRRGWWGDMDAKEIWDGWPVGCKNWLLTRAKITTSTSAEGNTAERAKRYTQEALQPFIDKRIASRVTVGAVRTDLDRIEVTAAIFRGPLLEINLRYQYLWNEES